ncbi:MAG: potassium transporter TrkG [Spirochaetales bacterium]|nr:potassium transporter TrkG [Spirochaetales bacterium]
MNGFVRSDRVIIFSYFVFMILLGSLLLSLPVSWNGAEPLAYHDALFTSVSAVCVTGLAVVDTADFSRTGQIFLLTLIQLGGLGIITFSTLFLIIPGLRMSLNRSQILLDFNPEKGKRDPRRIIRIIIFYTLAIEGTGAFVLARLFAARGVPEPIFTGIFHGVSAFCNAGFSRFSNSLEDFALDLPVNLTIMALIITGGLGFMVNRDLVRRVVVPGHRLRYHTKLMLLATGALNFGGALFFLVTEGKGLFARYNGVTTTWGERILLAFFQSITERTAGFNSVPQGELSLPGQFFSLLLMIIGGGSGSTAGGIKVTTALMIFFVMTNGLNTRGEVRFFKRRIPAELIARAGLFFLKAMGFLFIALLALIFTEQNNPAVMGNHTALIFETFSALGTVGLSHGITSLLTGAGKGIIIVIMFAGRVGLFTMILPRRDRVTERHIDWPTGEVLIG